MRVALTEEIEVIYCDDEVLVVRKPAGLAVQADLTGDESLMDVLAKEYGKLWVVHRLDRVVGGVMVYARTQRAAASLSQQVRESGGFGKEYYAVIPGKAEGSGHYHDLIFHDTRSHRAFCVDRKRVGVKDADLSWCALETQQTPDGIATLVNVTLQTGRFHQIRVQFASRGMPLFGDGKYGSRIKCPVALFAHRLSFVHPTTGRSLVFSAHPGCAAPWSSFAVLTK